MLKIQYNTSLPFTPYSSLPFPFLPFCSFSFHFPSFTSLPFTPDPFLSFPPLPFCSYIFLSIPFFLSFFLSFSLPFFFQLNLFLYPINASVGYLPIRMFQFSSILILFLNTRRFRIHSLSRNS